jgi:hypothetical protein
MPEGAVRRPLFGSHKGNISSAASRNRQGGEKSGTIAPVVGDLAAINKAHARLAAALEAPHTRRERRRARSSALAAAHARIETMTWGLGAGAVALKPGEAESAAIEAEDRARAESAEARGQAPRGWWSRKRRSERAHARGRIAVATLMGDGVDEATAARMWASRAQLDALDERASDRAERRVRALASCESGPWGTYDGRLALELETGEPARAWRTCGNRFCPTCARRQTRRIRERAAHALEGVSAWSDAWRPMMLTLTMRDAPSRTWGAAFSLASRALSRLTSTTAFKKHVRLAVAAIEVPRSTPRTRARARVVSEADKRRIKPYSKGWFARLARDGIDARAMLAHDDGRGEWWHAHVHVVLVPRACDDPLCLRCAYLGGKHGATHHREQLARVRRRGWDAIAPATLGVWQERRAEDAKRTLESRRPWLAWNAVADAIQLELERETTSAVMDTALRGQWLDAAWLLEEWRAALVDTVQDAARRARKLEEIDARTLNGDERRAALEAHGALESAPIGQLMLEAPRLRQLDDDEKKWLRDAHARELFSLADLRYREEEQEACGPWRPRDVRALVDEMRASGVISDDGTVPQDAAHAFIVGGARIERVKGTDGKPRENVLREILKYAAKPLLPDDGIDLATLAEMIRDARARRRFRCYGELFGVALERAADEDEEEPKTADKARSMFVVDGTTVVVLGEALTWRTVLPSTTLARAYALLEEARAPP